MKLAPAATTIILSAAALSLYSADKDFVDTGLRINMTIVSSGQLSAQRTSTPSIRALADTAIRFHRQLAAELQQLAQKEKVSMYTAPDTGKSRENRQLEPLSGKQFDTTYLRNLSADQEALIELFQQEAGLGRDSLTREFAKKTLPDLRRYQARTADARQAVSDGK